MIKVTYFYSACVSLETKDFRVLCDPWFTPGAYDGAWYQYPKPPDNAVEKIGFADFIYISHIHPDHYDSVFLRKYLERYPEARILIANFSKNFLSLKMTKDKIPHSILGEAFKKGKTEIKIFPNESHTFDIDSALVVNFEGDDRKHTVVNMNDNLYHAGHLDQINEYCQNQIDIALMTYTGAGPYPQTYFDLEKDQAVAAQKAQEKKEKFFERYLMMKKKLSPKKTIPFAGKYQLGGRLVSLNAYRGIADAVEVAAFDPDAMILGDFGGWIDTEKLSPSSLRTKPYPLEDLNKFYQEIKSKPLLCEVEFAGLRPDSVPWGRLLGKAYQNAAFKSEVEQDYWFCLSLPENQWFVMNAKKGSAKFYQLQGSEELPKERHEIHIDFRQLLGLLTGVYHWNNAEIGSLYESRRYPDVYHPRASTFLSFFHL